ncbi:hypothetical protein [Sphingobacterium sp. DR205]|uniref:hypothetical protein n=1 Tax=Sphingobacterium sp. DR205 TaxID=2713573 RepID=UPI0013E49F82|nr:hypothetical protein [Sphingobacterium sp. DR205]QIH34152.1 hypothetical protein G6053_15205 [Sphingobacterium sp. DR205]
MKRINAPLFVHLCFVVLTFYALLTDGDWLRYFTGSLDFNLIIFRLQVAGLIYAGYLQAQRNRKVISILWPALIGLIILISCVLITGNYQFNKNIGITIVWIILEAYYICYEILIGDLIEKIPFLLNLNYGFQAQCIYVILSGVLIGYVMFRSIVGFVLSLKSIIDSSKDKSP